MPDWDLKLDYRAIRERDLELNGVAAIRTDNGAAGRRPHPEVLRLYRESLQLASCFPDVMRRSLEFCPACTRRCPGVTVCSGEQRLD
jgi:hypothetical protein